MTLDVTTGMATDDLCWDGTEAVTHHFKRREGAAQVDTYARAKRRALTTKEIAKSGGVYNSDDIVWLIPARFVVNAPKPADWLVPADDTEDIWTVLEVQLGKLRNTYRCVTRNPFISGRLYDVVTIERDSNLGEQGQTAARAEPSWRAVYTGLRCRVQPEDAAAVTERGVHGFSSRFTVYLPYPIDVKAQDRVRHGALVYDVVAYRNAGRLEELPSLEVELKP